jgi:UDP-N-acetylglucosamine--N-acetylmuramyl-(pentapeptide) pyrophosphoryl-undecaprenol N-acetylglucosamine transferase
MSVDREYILNPEKGTLSPGVCEGGSSMKRIVLTGGGTAGHVMPNLALLPKLRNKGWEVIYIGSYDGIERELIEEQQVTFYPVATGKFRRYLSVQNFTDPFRVVKGLIQSYRLLKKLRPQVVFSKGGFVAVPVTIGAWLNQIPVVLHESDLTPGLANRLALPFASAVCATFPETIKFLPKGKRVLTGNPIRPELLAGSKEQGLKLCDFTPEKPVLLVMGGSLGSVTINRLIRAILPDLLLQFQVAHICGQGNVDEKLTGFKGYKQFAFLGLELPHIMAAADICISRAGANFLFELLALKKPHLLIPLPKSSSRGDQILNAQSFKGQNFSMVLYEEEITETILKNQILALYQNRQDYIKAMSESNLADAATEILRVIETTAAPVLPSPTAGGTAPRSVRGRK